MKNFQYMSKIKLSGKESGGYAQGGAAGNI